MLELAGQTLPPLLERQGVALVFERPSARTRNACEMAVVQLGGHPVTIRAEEVGLDEREQVEDVARTLACYHSLLAARVARHSTLERMARALLTWPRPVPVVNLLSDLEHPTQAIADLLTIRQELGRLAGVRVAYVGDANNVCRSLVDACALSGASVAVASPEGYGLRPADLERAEGLSSEAGLGGQVSCTTRPEEAVEGADVVYTDVWVSMGDEQEATRRRLDLAGYRVDERLLGRAGAGAIFLHCLPAHRGEEVSAEAIEGPRSRVWRQAEQRMHAARALFAYVLGARPAGTVSVAPAARG